MDVAYVSVTLAAAAILTTGEQSIEAPVTGCMVVPSTKTKPNLFWVLSGLFVVVMNRRRSRLFS
jgi:hypothetical protein